VRRGVRLALDLGEARIGVAACDADGTLAYPVTTLPAGPAELDALDRLVAEYEPVVVVVGLPRSLSGGEGPAAVRIRARAAALAERLAGRAEVRLVDERLTTVTAAQQLRAAGRSARRQRALIDAAAAVTILEHALAGERSQGITAGELVSPGAPGAPSSPKDDQKE
jgi:putative holliday junction resolvase